MHNWFSRQVAIPGIFIIALIAMVVSSGAESESTSEITSDPDVYKPASDFNFIRRFICISDLFSEEQWTKEKGRTFSEEGVLLTNGRKHPVNICHYALFCYDEFKSTGVSKYKDAFLSQVKCLMDTSYYHSFDDDKIAYPYHIKFHDLRPPWYSALAQSEAISVLIRYYAMTGDTAVLPVIVKIRNFMVSPAEFSCGTMSKTAEGFEWYEEYPNSVQEKQVLNGFLLAIVALHEFSMLFPNDVSTRELYENSIKTVKATFSHYDTGTWLRYNRGDKRTVNNGYMKWQILELKLLYQLTGDEYFKHLLMMLATYTYNKPYDAPGSKLKDYDFSVPLTQDKNGVMYFEGKRGAIELKTEVLSHNTNSNCKITATDFSKLSDNNLHTFASLCVKDSVTTDEFILEFKLKKNFKIEGMKISFAGYDSLKKPESKIFYKDSLKSTTPFRQVKITETSSDVKSVQYYFDPVACNEIQIKIKRTSAEKNIKISEIKLTGPPEKKAFEFCHFTTKVYEAAGGIAVLDFNARNIKNLAIFSKSADSLIHIDKEKWNPLVVKSSVPATFSASRKKYYRFLIVAEPRSRDFEIKNLTFKELN